MIDKEKLIKDLEEGIYFPTWYFYSFDGEYVSGTCGYEDCCQWDGTLEEFIEIEKYQNLINTFLKDIDIKNIFYVGFQEFYDEDLNKLMNIMRWDKSKVKIYKRNRGTTDYSQIDESIIKRITDLNQKDIDLYNEALEIRKSGLWHNREYNRRIINETSI